MLPAPRGRGDLVAVHRKGERGRTAALPEPADDRAQRGIVEAVAAQFDGDRRADQASFAEQVVISGDKNCPRGRAARPMRRSLTAIRSAISYQ